MALYLKGIPMKAEMMLTLFHTQTHAPKTVVPTTPGILPGLLLASLIAAAAFALRMLPGVHALSPLILAILLGMAFHNLIGTPASAKAGVRFSLKRVLRAGIVLLGLQLTLSQVVAVGGTGVLVIAVTLVSTFAFTVWLGRMLKVDARLTELIAAGTSICGASAVIATNTVTRARDEDVAYAVACVTVFGSLSMMLYPVLGGLMDLGPHAFGLWAGASIHEVAQVVAAAYQRGTEAGEFGTIAKLTRVMMLARARHAGRAAPQGIGRGGKPHGAAAAMVRVRLHRHGRRGESGCCSARGVAARLHRHAIPARHCACRHGP